MSEGIIALVTPTSSFPAQVVVPSARGPLVSNPAPSPQAPLSNPRIGIRQEHPLLLMQVSRFGGLSASSSPDSPPAAGGIETPSKIRTTPCLLFQSTIKGGRLSFGS